MDKIKDTMKKGAEKVTRTDKEPLQEDRKPALNAAMGTMGTSEQRSDLTSGPDQNLARASHSGDAAGMTGKASMGQPTNKPRP